MQIIGGSKVLIIRFQPKPKAQGNGKRKKIADIDVSNWLLGDPPAESTVNFESSEETLPAALIRALDSANNLVKSRTNCRESPVTAQSSPSISSTGRRYSVSTRKKDREICEHLQKLNDTLLYHVIPILKSIERKIDHTDGNFHNSSINASDRVASFRPEYTHNYSNRQVKI